MEWFIYEPFDLLLLLLPDKFERMGGEQAER